MSSVIQRSRCRMTNRRYGSLPRTSREPGPQALPQSLLNLAVARVLIVGDDATVIGFLPGEAQDHDCCEWAGRDPDMSMNRSQARRTGNCCRSVAQRATWELGPRGMIRA